MATTTPNFGWSVPTSTDLVKDGATAIETLGDAIDASLVDLKGGTTGQVLAKNSNSDMDFTWSNVDPLTILDAKGDLITATAADTPARLASSGVNGQVLTVDSTTSTGLKWATASSGVTWTQKAGPSVFGTATLTGIAYNGSNLYAVATASGTLFTSPDLVTWTSRTSGFGSSAIYNIIYANSLWVAVGASGLISTSSDGVTWTVRTSGVSTNALYQVIYANSLFVAVGDGANGGTGGVTTSSDGLTWTKRTTPTTSSTGITSIAYGNGYFVAVGELNTVCGYYSSNGTTWTVLGATANINATYINYQNGNWLMFGYGVNGKYRASDPTGTWSTISGGSPLPTIVTYNNNAASAIGFYDNKFYFVPVTSSPSVVGVIDSNLTGTQLTTIYTPIPAPVVSYGTSTINGGSYALYVNSTGGMLLGGTGRIWSSF